MNSIRIAASTKRVLQELARDAHNTRVVRRAQALVWLAEGERVEQVAERLQVTRQSVYNWIETLQERADEPIRARLGDRPHTGRPATQLALALVYLPELLKQLPSSYGYREQLWTAPLLGREIERQSQRPLGTMTVRRALAQLDYAYKRPRYVLARRAPNWQQAKGGSKPP